MQAFTESANGNLVYCHHGCGWYDGELEDYQWIEVAYEGTAEDFNLDDAICSSAEMVRAPCGCEDDRYDHSFSVVDHGDDIWRCGECEDMYIEESDAVACCQ
jgi:hypothetical protein